METDVYKQIYDVEDKHWWFVSRLKLIGNYLPVNVQNIRLLDIGCGTGLVAKTFSDRGYDVYALDISDDALNYCRKRGLKNLYKGNIMKLGFKAGYFDFVTCLDVIYHTQVKNDAKALKEIFRVLKPGGKLILTSCASSMLSGKHDIAVHTRHRYSLQEMKMKLLKAGFSIEKASYFNTFIFPFVYIMRKIDDALNRNKPPKSDLKIENALVNSLMKSVLAVEIMLLRVINLPFGVSLFCVARKPK